MDRTSAKQLDKLYTDRTLSKRFIQTATTILNLGDDQEFIEPSAGAGAFSDNLKNVKAYDIAPEKTTIKQADFLTLEPEWDRNAIAIGNPPFGKRASLALEFVNACCRTCSAVCFILPSTFKRYNVQRNVDDRFALVYEEDIREDGSFNLMGNPVGNLRCVFQIWVDKETRYMREGLSDLRMNTRPPISHPDFECWIHNATEESKKYLHEDWKYAFWRQGYKDYSKTFTRDDYDEVKDIFENNKKETASR